MLPRKTGSGLAASWNVLTGITAGQSPFSEGSTPTENNATYDRRSAVYKELGKKKSVTDRMLAAGRSFIEQEAEQTEVAIREVIQNVTLPLPKVLHRRKIRPATSVGRLSTRSSVRRSRFRTA